MSMNSRFFHIYTKITPMFHEGFLVYVVIFLTYEKSIIGYRIQKNFTLVIITMTTIANTPCLLWFGQYL